MMSIALYLDIDGVLNQYRISERKRRFKIGFKYTFVPFPKKYLRLNKLIKKYNIDVYLFSAWTKEDLKDIVPFDIKSDTRKRIKRVNEISKSYSNNILIDDEIHEDGSISSIDDVELSKNITPFKIDGEYGLTLKDIKKLDYLLKRLVNEEV